MPSNPSNAFRRPSMFIGRSVHDHRVNFTWVAEYMATHNLTMEVALEHLAKEMKDFAKDLSDTVDKLEGSDEQLLADCKVFCDGYKHMEDFYSPIPLIQMVKEP